VTARHVGAPAGGLRALGALLLDRLLRLLLNGLLLKGLLRLGRLLGLLLPAGRLLLVLLGGTGQFGARTTGGRQLLLAGPGGLLGRTVLPDVRTRRNAVVPRTAAAVATTEGVRGTGTLTLRLLSGRRALALAVPAMATRLTALGPALPRGR
jgi:hypothetical protein